MSTLSELSNMKRELESLQDRFEGMADDDPELPKLKDKVAKFSAKYRNVKRQVNDAERAARGAR